MVEQSQIKIIIVERKFPSNRVYHDKFWNFESCILRFVSTQRETMHNGVVNWRRIVNAGRRDANGCYWRLWPLGGRVLT